MLKRKFCCKHLIQSNGSLLSLEEVCNGCRGLNIGNRDGILELSWLMENGFSVDTQDRYLRNVKSGQVIPCAFRRIPDL